MPPPVWSAPGPQLVPDDEDVARLEPELADERPGDGGEDACDELGLAPLEGADAHDRRMRRRRLLRRRVVLPSR